MKGGEDGSVFTTLLYWESLMVMDCGPGFIQFRGQIRFKDYIATFRAGDVHVEDAAHPVLKGVPFGF